VHVDVALPDPSRSFDDEFNHPPDCLHFVRAHVAGAVVVVRAENRPTATQFYMQYRDA
jgi:hypothetical protein